MQACGGPTTVTRSLALSDMLLYYRRSSEVDPMMGWMDAWMDGCMDGWMHGWMDALL
jgi:hypothetical protein